MSQVELYVFLIRFGTDFVLIDAGPPGEDYAAFLLKGLKKEIGSGQLRLVVLTHGHIDHVGGLPALKQAYPDAHVAFHSEESPYLTGQPHRANPSCINLASSTHLHRVVLKIRMCEGKM